MKIEWDQTAHLAIAVSGGVDSMVLLDMVRRSGHYRTLSILHVNHGLRDASEMEQHMIEDYAEQFNLPCYVTRVPQDLLPEHRSIQSEARDFRYEFFNRIMAEHGLEVLLTAHHRNDALETILFRLLTSRYHYQPLSITSNYPLYRPLLDTDKKAIYQIAEAFQIPYMEDESNNKSDYTRNAIRHQLIPQIDAIEQLHTESLIDLAAWHQDILELLNAEALKFLDSQGSTINRLEFRQLHKRIKPFVIIQWFSQHTHYSQLSHHYIEEIIRVIDSPTTQTSYNMPCEWSIEIVYDKLMLRKKEHIAEYLKLISPGKYPFNNYEITIHEPLEMPLEIRLKKDGDKILIGYQHQKISRIMKDMKVPSFERTQMPIILYDGQIIAVGDLKHSAHDVLNQITIKRSDKDA